MPSTPPRSSPLPPIRACIFDVDGLLINSEDIYTTIYNNILHSYSAPSLPWSIKAKQQSRGREGMLELLDWAQLPITYEEWTTQCSAQHHLFESCLPLPGVEKLLSTLSLRTEHQIYVAIASSSSSKTFKLKTGHLPNITSYIPEENRVFGDDRDMSDARKKPCPDIFLLALRRLNALLEDGERPVRPEETLVFEDSIAGVQAGRRAGMRVCWVPHFGLRDVYRGSEGRVLSGQALGSELDLRQEVEGGERDGKGVKEEGGKSDPASKERLWSRDGWAEMRMSVEGFDYEGYGIKLKER